VVLKNRDARDPRPSCLQAVNHHAAFARLVAGEKKRAQTARGTFQSAKINLIEKTALRAWLRNRRSAVEVREPAKRRFIRPAGTSRERKTNN